MADCCSDKNGVAGSLTIEEKKSVSSEPDEIVSHKSWRQIFHTRPEGSKGFDCFLDMGYSKISVPCGARL